MYASQSWVKELVTRLFKKNNEYMLSKTNSYSLEEQVIGTWVDGKPLYQRTFSATTPSSSSAAIIIDTTILDTSIIEKVVSIKGTVKSTSGLFMPINLYYSSSEFICTYYHPNGIYMLTPYKSYQNTACFITLQYTKITD